MSLRSLDKNYVWLFATETYHCNEQQFSLVQPFLSSPFSVFFFFFMKPNYSCLIPQNLSFIARIHLLNTTIPANWLGVLFLEFLIKKTVILSNNQ